MFPKACGQFLFFPGGLLMAANITRRVPRYTQKLHRARTVATAPSKTKCKMCGDQCCTVIQMMMST